jgi:hypothetical protein
VSSSLSLQENCGCSEDQTFDAEFLQNALIWDTVFWLFLFMLHVVLVVAMSTPVDFYVLLSSVFLQIHFLTRLLQPVDHEHKSIAHNNSNILGVAVGALIAFVNIPVESNGRYIIVFMLIFLDYFLIVGHTWDACTRVGTVFNCRLAYICVAPICMITIYVIWQDRLLYNQIKN